MERELYNLKTKILRSKHISDQLREELANDVFEIEKLVNKTNDIHLVSKAKRTSCRCGLPYSEKDLQDGMCNKCCAPTTEY